MFIPDGWAQVNLVFGGSDFPEGAQVVFGVDVATYVGTAQDAADDIAAIVNSRLASQWGGLTLFEEVRVKFGPVASGAYAVSAGGGGGSGAGTNVTANTAVLIRKATQFGGRQNSGRMFWPWVSEGNVTGAGFVAGGTVTALQNAMNLFLSDLAAADLSLALLHSGVSPEPQLVTSLAVQSKVATQRRRLRR
jgi:hypothetical protein